VFDEDVSMPMIDVYAATDLFPAGTGRQLAEELTKALLRAEGVTAPGPIQLNNTAAYLHFLRSDAVHTAATSDARTVRIQVITPPAALTREGQKQLVREATEIVARLSGDPSLAGRTWFSLAKRL
jgi:phenylpyruvate tautomerase PptA (4-oxalocrotonate tautomerase family)